VTGALTRSETVRGGDAAGLQIVGYAAGPSAQRDEPALRRGAALIGYLPYANLPCATFMPHLVMTNFGTKPVNASVLFARTTDSGPESTNVATVSVPAMSSSCAFDPL